ncbi:MAG: helix-turn-helix transcriptional regulator, partial [Solirubrobacteraceae bacterium]
DHAQALALLEWGRRDATERGEGSAVGATLWLAALLHNGHGHYGEALAAARKACEHEDVVFYGWALVELIEAGVRDGRPDEAAAALDRLSERTLASGTQWALGIEARCRGLLSDDEVLYHESVERLACSRAVIELARSRLLYGEWLRRENRRIDAREQLRSAHEMFSRMGAAAFAERARRELSATGETVRKRTVETVGELTTQEAQVARLAAQGHTNPEIGALLFISPRTVEYHLHKVFPKLGISSRRELRKALQGAEDTAVPA